MYRLKRWVIGGVLGATVAVIAFYNESMTKAAHEQERMGATDQVITMVRSVAQLLNKLDLVAPLEADTQLPLQYLEEVCQANLLRRPNQERWQMEQKWQDKLFEVLPLFHAMKLLNEIMPKQQEYDYALVMGASTVRMRDRLAYLEKLVAAGVIIRQVVLLAGIRKLDPQIDDVTLGETEADAMQAIWLQSTLSGTHHVILLVAAEKILPDGRKVRPNTDDTVLEWLLKEKPVKGTVLVISNQPYIQRQTLVAQRLLPKDWLIEGVGPAAIEKKVSVAGVCDEVARTVHELFLRECSKTA